MFTEQQPKQIERRVNDSSNKKRTSRQAIQLRDNRQPLQRQAWIITRKLNLGFSSSSNSSSPSHAPYYDNKHDKEIGPGKSYNSVDRSDGAVASANFLESSINSIVNSDQKTRTKKGSGSKNATSGAFLEGGRNIAGEEKKTFLKLEERPLSPEALTLWPDRISKIENLKFHHRHILFDSSHELPIVGLSDNIGYGGTLYTEKHLDAYEKNNAITQGRFEDRSPLLGGKSEDEVLIEAIKDHAMFGDYDLLNNNCQHWVNAVLQTFENKIIELKNFHGVQFFPLKIERVDHTDHEQGNLNNYKPDYNIELHLPFWLESSQKMQDLQSNYNTGSLFPLLINPSQNQIINGGTYSPLIIDTDEE